MWILMASALAFGADEPASPMAEAVHLELSQRHDVTCDAVWALGAEAEVRDGLLAVANEATMPPWAPVNAARCLVPRYGTDAVVTDQIKAWMADAELGGLALVVAQSVDELAEEQAMELDELADKRAAKDARFEL